MRHETKTRGRDKSLRINGRDMGNSATIHPGTETGGRKILSTETRRRQETPAPAAGISGNFFRIADRHPMEGVAERIWGGQ
jgi:hypothetical protein